MKGVILAAGMATRLSGVTGGKPKCLLPVGDRTILQRAIEHLLAAGIEELVIVLGYKAKLVRAFVKQTFPFRRIRFAVNPKFESTNNAFSLLMAREHFVKNTGPDAQAEGMVLLDADIVFSPRLLPKLLRHPAENKIAVRVKGDHDEEEVRVRVDESGTVRSIGKSIRLEESYGESVGIETFSADVVRRLFEILEDRVKTGIGRTEFYEASFQVLLDEGVHMQAVDVSDAPSIEIDTPEDFERAQSIVVSFLGG